MKMLILICKSANKEAIINCFLKASISQYQQRVAVNDDDPFKALAEKIKSSRAQKADPAQEFTSNNLLKIDDGLVCTESLLTDDKKIQKFTITDDGDDDDDCSGDNNEDDEVQVIKHRKTSVNGATHALLTYTLFDNKQRDRNGRLTSRIGSLLERGWLTRLRQQSIEQYLKG